MNKRGFYQVFLFDLSAISGWIGAIFGGLAELPYGIGTSTGAGWISGLISGVIVAIAYSSVMIRSSEKDFVSLSKKGLRVGIVAGTCSTVVIHITLVIVYSYFQPIVLLVGLLCGIVMGALTGLVSNKIFLHAHEKWIVE